jgi:hypothetical protein
MYTKVAMALATVFGSATGALAASRTHTNHTTHQVLRAYQGHNAYGRYQGQNLYDLSDKIHRDTFTHD